jgi:hypothetical protein
LSPWQSQQVSIAAYSIVLITLHRDGGAEAYSFVVPNSTNSTIEPLQQTVCGSKYDPLAFTVPC